MLSTVQHAHKYTARIFNISQNSDISDYVSEINIDMPKAKEISSMVAKFILDEKLIDSGNEIKIEILDEVSNVIYSLNGEAILNSINYIYTNADKYSYTVKESYSKLFDKVISKTETYYDLYLCNSGDKNNSLLHIVAKKLNFKNLDFENARYLDSKFIRVPFVIFKENERWIDELQSLIAATNSILYIENGKLIFRFCDSILNNNLEFNQTNIITSMEKHLKHTESNGIKVLYDKYERLENQVVFNVSKKILVNVNTNKDTQVKSMRIKYITSSVANPVITKATAYYFTREDDINSKVEINLVEGTHYVLDEFTETGAIVKFYNPTNYLIYIDNFEIKGIPLVMYKDNEAVVKDSNVLEKHQENFQLISKNKYVQTLEIANYIAEQEYSEKIKSEYSYKFDTCFLNNLKLGNIYGLAIKDVSTKGRVISYSIHLKPSDFRLKVQLEEVKEVRNIKKSNTDNLTPATQFIDLTNIEKAIENNKKEMRKSAEKQARATEIINKKMLSVLHKREEQPTNAKEYDIWLNPKTNVFKQFLNGKWVPAAEEDILPSIKFANSLEKAKLDIGKVNERAGMFLTNNDEKFGSSSELAEVSLDKEGHIKIANPNNLIDLSAKDPTDPTKLKSKVYLGVSDVTKIPDDVKVQIGDEATGFTLVIKENGENKATIDGKNIIDKFSDVDKNINNLGIIDSENKKMLNNRMDEINSEFTNANGRLTKLQQDYQETVQDVTNFKTQTADRIETVQGALDNGNFVITGNTSFDGAARFVSRGTNEVITINNGSIDFHRNGQKLTRIKNIRYGSIPTDSRGKGIVNFEGFQQPMLVLPTIKSANFGKNMASVFCYTEHIENCKYRFYVGGTNEDYREARPVKAMGTSWSANNVVITNLLGYGGVFEERNMRPENYKIYTYGWGNNQTGENRIISMPKIRIKITLNGIELYRKDYTLKGYVECKLHSYGSYAKIEKLNVKITKFDFSTELNMLKKFSKRTNVRYKLSIQILDDEVVAEGYHSVSINKTSGHTWGQSLKCLYFKGLVGKIKLSDIKNLFITASAETSTISSATGTGEVSYIAMEID